MLPIVRVLAYASLLSSSLLLAQAAISEAHHRCGSSQAATRATSTPTARLMSRAWCLFRKPSVPKPRNPSAAPNPTRARRSLSKNAARDRRLHRPRTR